MTNPTEFQSALINPETPECLEFANLCFSVYGNGDPNYSDGIKAIREALVKAYTQGYTQGASEYQDRQYDV